MKRFTLIELLIVVAIIALLLTILLPSLKHAGDAARKAVCQSNMKQLSLGIETYKKDYNGRLPKAVMAASTTWTGKGNYQEWKALINAYMSQSETTSTATGDSYTSGIYACPKRNVTLAYTGGFGWNSDYLAYEEVDEDTAGINYIGIMATSISNPSETLLIGDTTDSGNWNDRVCRAPNGNADRIGNRHNEKINVLWSDSHVSLEKRTTMLNGKDGKRNYFYLRNKDTEN